MQSTVLLSPIAPSPACANPELGGAELTKSTYINRHDDQKKESFKMRASTALVIVGRAEAEAPRAHKPH